MPEDFEDVIDDVKETINDIIPFDVGSKPKFSIKRAWKTSKLVMFLLSIITILGLVIYINILNSQHIKELERTYKEAFEKGVGQETIDISPEISIDKSTILESLRVCAELTTIKYEYADIGDYTKDKKLFDKITIPFTTDKVIYAYKGVISVGIKDFNKTKIDIDEKNKIIKITLPKLEILNHKLLEDKFKTYNVKDSKLTEMSIDNYNDFVRALKEAQEELLLGDTDFWETARKESKNTVSKIMSLYNLPEGYKIEVVIE